MPMPNHPNGGRSGRQHLRSGRLCSLLDQATGSHLQPRPCCLELLQRLASRLDALGKQNPVGADRPY